ncbi:MAG: phenylalanine--tRNA ligase subunit beta [Endomicrobiia bacterium]
MKLSLNWLKELIGRQNNITDQDIIDALPQLGYEVEGIYKFDKEVLSNIKVVKILKVEKHPNADKLSLCEVTDGKNIYKVVCGAPNVTQNMIAAYVPAGGIIGGGVVVKNKEIRGVVSEGMLCSAKELKLYEDHSGILSLDESFPLGETLDKHLDDTVIEISTPANRYDCLGHAGIAKELKIKFNLEVTEHINPLSYLENKKLPFFNVKISSYDLCKRYIAINMTSINNKVKLPFFIRFRLNILGLRSINPLVDISNYVMLEVGHSIHIFDANKLYGDKIIIRNAKEKEKVIALDGKTYELSSDCIVISDEQKPIAIGGIIGAENSCVEDETTNIVIESAVFNQSKIRLARKNLNINTEASYRFERGSSFFLCELAAAKAYQMIEKYCGGEVVKFVDEKDMDYYNEIVSFNTNGIKVELDFLESLLGITVDPQKFINIVQNLGGKIKFNGENILTTRSFIVVPPLTRQDIKFPADIAEEIMRFIGYDKIPETLPHNIFEIKNNADVLKEKIVTILSSTSLNEVINYSLCSAKDNEVVRNNENLKIKLLNPVSNDYSELRLSLLSGLIRNLLVNYNNQVDTEIGLFEIGKVFYKADKKTVEEEKVGILIYGKKEILSWKKIVLEYDFYYAIGIIEKLFEKLNINYTKNLSYKSSKEYLLLNEEFLSKILYFLNSEEEIIGFVSELNKEKFKLKLPGSVFYCEVSLNNLRKSFKKDEIFDPIVKFPCVFRDLCIVVNRDISYQQIIKTMYSCINKDIILDVTLIDYYQKENFLSLTFSLKFQNKTKTLTDEEVDLIIKEMLEKLSKYDIKLREK